LQVGDTGPVESARRSNSRVLGSPFSGLSGQMLIMRFRYPRTMLPTRNMHVQLLTFAGIYSLPKAGGNLRNL
jgi:hypothetical protein